MTKETEENIGAVTDSVSLAIVTSNEPEITDESAVIEEENKGIAKDALTQLFEDLENNEVANAIDSIVSKPYLDPRGECTWIQPMLKLSYSICPSTPTVEMQKAAIKRLAETMENNMEAEYGRNLKQSFELNHTILGKDTVTFIGKINEFQPEINTLTVKLNIEGKRLLIPLVVGTGRHTGKHIQGIACTVPAV